MRPVPELTDRAGAARRHGSHVLVIGGGIAGLSAAWYLQRSGAAVSYTLLEAGDRWGGKIQTDHVGSPDGTPFVVEAGPDSILTRKPWAIDLVRELGLDDHIIGTRPQARGTYVLHHGRLVALPAGLELLAPTRFLPFARSPLFSIRGKLRMLLDLAIPARRSASDETLASFITRRLGREALDKVGEPLLGGIFNTDPERQSLLATFPNLRALESRHGSLIRGFRSTRAGAKRSGQSGQSVGSGPSPFVSLRGGLAEVVTTLTDQLTGDLRLGVAATALAGRTSRGFSVSASDGTSIEADAVIVATAASVASSLVRDVAPDPARRLNEIRYTSSGTISLGYRQQDVPRDLDGFGVVIPRSEARSLDAMSWTSSKWPSRAPSGHVLIRAFFGGPKTPAMLDRADDQVLDAVQRELGDVLGISAAPLFHRIYRWPNSFPQYDLGHLDRVTAIEAGLPPDLFVTGSSYRGVGVPDCVHQSQETVDRLLGRLAERAMLGGVHAAG